MASISDKDRDVFKEAANTVLDTFTGSELGDIQVIASRLALIISQAKERNQNKKGR